MSVGKAIRKLRREKEMSQTKLANSVGVTQKTIYFWEHDKGGITVHALEKVAQALNVPITKFFEENNNVSNNKNIPEPRRIPDNPDHV